MYLPRDEFALLSRGGRVPPAAHPRIRPEWQREDRVHRPLRSRLSAVLRRSAQPAPGGRRSARIDIHQYLELEFTIDERRQAPPAG